MRWWESIQSWWRSRAVPEARGEGAPANPRVIVKRDWKTLELRFKAGTAQSRMSRWAPDRLMVDYTRTMLGALLLVPRPATVGMVGLGGGSQAKFLHRHLRDARLLVFENDPGVLALRGHFRIPKDDARLEVRLADAARELSAHREAFDLLLVDGYDVDGIPEALSTQRFYADCRASLRVGGAMAVNLYDTAHAEHLHRIRIAFGASNVHVVDEPRQSNRVAFAWVPPLAVAETPALAHEGLLELRHVFAGLCGGPFEARRAARDEF